MMMMIRMRIQTIVLDKNKDENKKTFSFCLEEEDSHPYRIVDLATQIAYDSAGYTFLEASKKEEENPYQKLNATKSVSCSWLYREKK